MLPVKFRNGIKVSKCSQQMYLKAYQILRNLTSTETLEPVKLSYATYESTGSATEADMQAPALVIMHGLFGSKANWGSLCKVYQQRTDPQRKIVAVDARNHGDSTHDKNHTYAHLAADIRAFLEQLKPELVDRLIVADISPVTTSPNLNSMPALFQALESVNLPSEIPMSQARATVDLQLSKSIPEKTLRSFLLTNLVQRDNGSYNWRVNIPVLLSNFNNIARFPLVNDLQYEGPVLFLGGGNSDFIHIPIVSFARTKSFQQADLLQNEDNFDLSYASYELTESYSKSSPQPTPLVILHGLMGSKNNWNSFCKRFHENNKNKVFALDARNHGDSPHRREHSYDNLVIDLRRFLYKMDIKKVCLLGHSMGGRAVMLFALKYPDLVEKLVVADMSPITTSSNFKKTTEILLVLKKLELPKNVPLSEARKLVGEILAPVVKSNAVTAFLLTNLVQKMDGRKSDYPNILKLFPNAELKFIEGAGHWLHSEKPAEFLNITLEFLNRKITSSD
ncbi:hypothetical protein NQ314_007325 [Rhamnusium bicolor]|uniref:sn-1-specific diacylglycerol lipase ABHD11 n=1 Tax=Rhamnusium bicolor TaxID=1586634 RepID=A0AAV8YSW2_9CUCU|nr:hypothetical protein NQ314_007325 [Rhamnusium bicolor]